MKIITTTVSMIAAAGMLAGVVALAEEHKAANEKDAAVNKSVQNEEEVKAQTTCPVMGGKINKDLYVDIDGKRVYVCCKGCIGKVKENPEKYIKKLEEQGVTLKSLECRKEAKAACRMKTEKGCRMKAEAACPKAKDCPHGKCTMAEKKEGHAGHRH